MFAKTYFDEVARISGEIDCKAIEKLVENLTIIRSNQGRLFILGVGGSAGNASRTPMISGNYAVLNVIAPPTMCLNSLLG